MIKKFLVLSVAVLFVVSCSSSDDGKQTSDATQTEATIAIVGRVDNVLYNFPSPSPTNTADASGGEYGSNYYLLKGTNTKGPASKTGTKTIDIKLVVPKSDLSLGIHNFVATQVAGEYYADMDISNTLPSETVNTISGYIKILSYNSSTKELKGAFNFTTDDGVNVGTTRHTVLGNFDYFLP